MQKLFINQLNINHKRFQTLDCRLTASVILDQSCMEWNWWTTHIGTWDSWQHSWCYDIYEHNTKGTTHNDGRIYNNTATTHCLLPQRTSTGYHSLSPRVYAAKQIWRFWPPRSFLGSRLWRNYLRVIVITIKLSAAYHKTKWWEVTRPGDWSLNRHTSALTECTDWSEVFKFRRIHVEEVSRKTVLH